MWWGCIFLGLAITGILILGLRGLFRAWKRWYVGLSLIIAGGVLSVFPSLMDSGSKKIEMWCCVGFSLITVGTILLGIFGLLRVWSYKPGKCCIIAYLVAAFTSLIGLFLGWYDISLNPNFFAAACVVFMATTINLPLPSLMLWLLLLLKKPTHWAPRTLAVLSLIWTGYLLLILPMLAAAACLP